MKGETKEELDAAATLIAELVADAEGSKNDPEKPKPKPVPKSGTGGGGGADDKSFSAGEEAYERRHPKKKD